MTDCLFCKMARKEITPDIVYEDEDILAFKDINPKAPVHVLIIPKKHVADVTELSAAEAAVAGRIQLVAAQIAREQGIAESGFRLLTNCKADGGQEVFHLHYHLIGGHFLGHYADYED